MKKKSLLTYLLICLLAVSVLVTGCGGGSGTDEPSTDVATGEPQKGGKVTIGLSQVPKNLDPIKYTGTYESDIMRSIYDTVVIWNDDQTEIVGGLATDWTVSEDMKEYTFTLRDDVYFHNKRLMTAEDVKYSLERSATQSDMGRLEDLQEAIVIDDTHVKLVLKAPNAAFLARLTDSGNGIVPKEVVEEKGDKFGQEPVGTGPYMYESWAKDDNVTLAKFDQYWLVEPNLDKVVFKFIPDLSMMANALISGDIDIANEIAGPDIQKIEASKKHALQRMAGMNVYFMAMNMQEGPTADPKVREAIALALDVDAAVKNIFQFGGGTRAFAPIPESSWGFDESFKTLAPKQDVEKSKQLLAEAGYPEGFDTTIVTPNKPLRAKWAEIMQAQLAEVGIKASIEKLEWGTYSDKVAKNQAPIYLLGWTWYPDPDFFVYAFFHEDSIGTLGNGQAYNNPEVTALVDKAKSSTVDQEERKAIYKELVEIVMGEYAHVPGFTQENLIGVGNNVHEYDVCPDDGVRLVTPERNVWIAQ